MKKLLKLSPLLLAMLIIGLIIGNIWISHEQAQAPHIRKMKREILALAGDEAAIQQHLVAIRKQKGGRWTDGRVGVTGDGYVFFYDLHDSHGMDGIPDTNIVYLPDEKRFLMSDMHFCVDLAKWSQPRNKRELLPRFRSWVF